MQEHILIQARRHYRTHDGRKAFVVSINYKNRFPVFGYIITDGEKDKLCNWSMGGRCFPLDAVENNLVQEWDADEGQYAQPTKVDAPDLSVRRRRKGVLGWHEDLSQNSPSIKVKREIKERRNQIKMSWDEKTRNSRRAVKSKNYIYHNEITFMAGKEKLTEEIDLCDCPYWQDDLRNDV